MALIVEDGTGKSDAESYISVTDANAYHTARGNTAWTGADAAKEAALRKATAYIDGCYRHRWPGVKCSATQALDWPRSGASTSNGHAIETDEIPTAVIQVTAELALRALAADLAPDLARGGAIRRRKIGPIETEYEPGSPGGTIYQVSSFLLSGLLTPAGHLIRG